MSKLNELLIKAKGVFEEVMDDGYITCEADVADFATEEADMYLEKMYNEEKINLLLEVYKDEYNDGYDLKDFKLKKISTLQEAIDKSVFEILEDKILLMAKKEWC